VETTQDNVWTTHVFLSPGQSALKIQQQQAAEMESGYFQTNLLMPNAEKFFIDTEMDF